MDSAEFTSGTTNVTSGHSGHSATAQAADSLIVPNLNQVTSSTSSSRENDEQLSSSYPIKTIVHRGNSADTAEEHQLLRKQKQHSFVSSHIFVFLFGHDETAILSCFQAAEVASNSFRFFFDFHLSLVSTCA